MKRGAYEFSKVRKILQIGELFCEKVNPRCLKAQKSGAVHTYDSSSFFGAFMRGSKPPVLPGERERAERQ